MSLKRPRESDDESWPEGKNQSKVETPNGTNGEPVAAQAPKQDSNLKSKHSKNIPQIDKSIRCMLPPLCSKDPQVFDSFSHYQLHYLANHTNICAECKKNFPTSKLLDLHIAENHDPFTKIKLQKGEPIFGCFVENCDRLFKDHKKRRLHLIDKHDYPKDYIFSIVDRGIGKNDTSLLKKNTKSYGVWKPA